MGEAGIGDLTIHEVLRLVLKQLVEPYNSVIANIQTFGRYFCTSFEGLRCSLIILCSL